MNIYIVKNGVQQGPFSLDEVRRQRELGVFGETDLVWHDGLSDWAPLARLLAGAPAPGTMPPPPPPIPVPYMMSGVMPPAPATPTGARLATAVVLFGGLFILLTVVIFFVGLIIGGSIVGAQIAVSQHAASAQEGYQLGHQAGMEFGRKWGAPILGISVLISLVSSLLLAWRVAFSNLLPWCRAR